MGILTQADRVDFIDVITLIPIVIGFIALLTAYILGGLGEALKSSFKIGVCGWLIVPFPVDIFTGIATMLYALEILVLIPIIPVRKSCKRYLLEHEVDLSQAESTHIMPSIKQIKEAIPTREENIQAERSVTNEYPKFNAAVHSYFEKCNSIEELDQSYETLIGRLQEKKADAISLVNDEYARKKSCS